MCVCLTFNLTKLFTAGWPVGSSGDVRPHITDISKKNWLSTATKNLKTPKNKKVHGVKLIVGRNICTFNFCFLRGLTELPLVLVSKWLQVWNVDLSLSLSTNIKIWCDRPQTKALAPPTTQACVAVAVACDCTLQHFLNNLWVGRK